MTQELKAQMLFDDLRHACTCVYMRVHACIGGRPVSTFVSGYIQAAA